MIILSYAGYSVMKELKKKYFSENLKLKLINCKAISCWITVERSKLSFEL